MNTNNHSEKRKKNKQKRIKKMTEIDTYKHKRLYGTKDIKKYGRYRYLPDISLSKEAFEWLNRIEKGADKQSKDKTQSKKEGEVLV